MHNGASPPRLRLILLLPLLMLLAQQGAWLHQLGHAAYSAGAHAQVLAQQPSEADEGGPCPTCQSFGQISFSASANAPQLAFLAPGYLPGTEPRIAVIAATQPTPRSRGPPSST